MDLDDIDVKNLIPETRSELEADRDHICGLLAGYDDRESPASPAVRKAVKRFFTRWADELCKASRQYGH